MITPNLTPRLERIANRAILRAMSRGVPTLGLAAPTNEPEFVAAVLFGAVPNIARSWRPLLIQAGLEATYSGVFCHQSPMATFKDLSGTRRQCELADLLLVFEETTLGVAGRRWAVLIQSKMAARQGAKKLTSPGDLRQLDLYSRWPAFELPHGFPAGARDFSSCPHAGSSMDCGRYGLIDGRIPIWHQRPPAAILPSSGDELGTFLARMAENRPGYGREASGITDDWSRTVEDLMRITFNRTFRVLGTKSRHPRGVSLAMRAVSGDVTGFIVPDCGYGDSGPPGGTIKVYDEGDGASGINLLHVGISRLEERDTGFEDLFSGPPFDA